MKYETGISKIMPASTNFLFVRLPKMRVKSSKIRPHFVYRRRTSQPTGHIDDNLLLQAKGIFSLEDLLAHDQERETFKNGEFAIYLSP